MTREIITWVISCWTCHHLHGKRCQQMVPPNKVYQNPLMLMQTPSFMVCKAHLKLLCQVMYKMGYFVVKCPHWTSPCLTIWVIFVFPCKGVGWIVLCEYGHLEPIATNANFASFTNFSITWGWANSTVWELAIVGWTNAPPNSFKANNKRIRSRGTLFGS